MKLCTLIILLFFINGCSYKYLEIDNGNEIIKLKIEIAGDNQKRTRGLMFREKLDENEGMLFVFEDSEIRNFWMKDTKIPLDIIFISEDFKIINLAEAELCNKDPCKIYSSTKEAKYVLEINNGLSKKNNIKEGDKITLR